MSGPKAKPDSLTTAQNSASSSSTTTSPPEKRTRDLPNLSDCHCCGRRINHTNPKDRLQPLDSVWRIVLLCRKCRKSVYSGQTCPYCFKGTGNSGKFIKCNVCKRKIHADCVRDYGDCTPWSYLGEELGFRICVDCWVPELLKNSSMVCRRNENKGMVKTKSDAKEYLECVAKDAKSHMERKVKMAEMAKEQALRKALVAKNAVDLANEALDLVGKKRTDGRKVENSGCSDAVEIVDDGETALQLHRAMDSSPRISGNKCLLNSSALDATKIRNWNGISYQRFSCGKHRREGKILGMYANGMEDEKVNWRMKNSLSMKFNESTQKPVTYKRDRKRKLWRINDDSSIVLEYMTNQPEQLNFQSDESQTTYSIKSDADAVQSSPSVEVDRQISQELVCVDADQRNSLIIVDGFGKNRIVYRRTRLRQKVCRVNDLGGVSGGQSCPGAAASKSDRCESDVNRSNCPFKYDKEVILPTERHNAEQDRYYIKYSKRVKDIKPDSNCLQFDAILNRGSCTSALSDTETVYSAKADSESVLPNGSSGTVPDRYCFKYVKRGKGFKSSLTAETKLLYGALQSQTLDSVPEFAMKCSAESGHCLMFHPTSLLLFHTDNDNSN